MAYPAGSDRHVSGGWHGEDLVPAERRRRGGCSGWLRSGVREAPQNIGLGTLIGVSLITVVMLIGQPAGWYSVTFSGLTTQFVTSLGLLFASVVVQELFFRGLLFTFMEWLFGSTVAVLLNAALFGAAHYLLPDTTAWAAAALALQAGVLLGVAYAVTRSLWMVISLNFSWAVTEALVFGAPVSGVELTAEPLFRTEVSGTEFWSGGQFGPEAGIIAVVLSGAVAVLLVSWGQGRGRFRSPFWLRARAARKALAEGPQERGPGPAR